MNAHERIAELEAEVLNLRTALKEACNPAFECPGETAHFTSKERQILCLLHNANGRIVKRAAIWDAIYSQYVDADFPEPKIIDVWISRIRRKLINHRIEGVWGVGCRMTEIKQP